MSAALAALPPTLSDYQPGSCLRAAGGADAMYGRNLALLRRGQTLLELLASIRGGFGHVADMNRSYAGGIHSGGGRMFDQVMAGAPAALLDWLRARGSTREFRPDVDAREAVIDLLQMGSDAGAKALLMAATRAHDADAERDLKMVNKWSV